MLHYTLLIFPFGKNMEMAFLGALVAMRWNPGSLIGEHASAGKGPEMMSVFENRHFYHFKFIGQLTRDKQFMKHGVGEANVAPGGTGLTEILWVSGQVLGG